MSISFQLELEFFFFASWTFFLPVKVFLKTKKNSPPTMTMKMYSANVIQIFKGVTFFFLFKKFNTKEVHLVINGLTR